MLWAAGKNRFVLDLNQVLAAPGLRFFWHCLPRPVAPKAADKKICRRKIKTGSLADYERHCATAAEWARMTDQTQREWGALQGTLGSTRGN